MPYTVGDGAIMQVSFEMVQFNQKMLSIFHFMYQTGGAPVDGNTLINQADAIINLTTAGALLADHVTATHESVKYEDIVYQWIWPIRYARVVKAPALSQGDVTGTPCPPNVAAALTKRADTSGRHYVGTLHMPGLIIENITEGVLNSGGVAEYDAILSSLKTVMVPAVFTKLIPVIYQRSAPASSGQIMTTDYQPTVRTMHRRTVGLGQ